MKKLFSAAFMLVGLTLSMALAACAPGPDSIPPVTAPAGVYDRLSCNQAKAHRATIQAGVTELERQQRAAVTGDAIGVFLLAIPVSSITGGNKAGLLGTEKGKLQAMDARLTGC